METKKKLGQSPVYPMFNSDGFPGLLDALYLYENKQNISIGINERRLIAKDVLCALLSNPNIKVDVKYEDAAATALYITDTFLKLESK